ncbi:MAG: hypothetical protein ACRDP5_27115 [Streptosporangiaceae bacterium]
MSHILAALALTGGYAVFLLIRPQKRCGRCKGFGGRRAACGRCGGTGKRFRPGARLVHRGAAAAGRYAARRIAERRDQS